MATKGSKKAAAPAQEVKSAPAKKAATKVEAPDASTEAEEVKSRGPRGVEESAVITLLAKTNPKREGSKAHARFAAYRDGQTVGAALDAGVTTPDLVYDAKHGFIHIDGYDPGEIITPKPKAEKVAKEPKSTKGGKVRAEKSAEQKAAEADVAAATEEETMD